MDQRKAKEIIETQLPGYELVEEVGVKETAEADDRAHPAIKTWSKFGAGSRPKSDAKRARLDALRQRFLSDSPPDAGYAGPPEADAAPAADANPEDTAMLLVKPKGSNAKPKAVFVEGGKIKTKQG